MMRVLLFWSSGKDSAWALHVLRKQTDLEVAALFTTINEAFGRVTMHAVRRELLEAQARETGLDLITVPLPWPCSNEAYESAVREAVAKCSKELSITHLAFGDLFLEDVLAYRERMFSGSGLDLLFPLWELPTETLAREMAAAGVRAVLTCVDPQAMPGSFAGREFDSQLLDELPDNVDPCGERGEFHTFAYAGPMFTRTLDIRIGEIVERDNFVFADLELGEPSIFDEDGALTRAFLLARGECCGNRCKNCPYGWQAVPV